MRLLMREDGETTLYRGDFDKPILNFSWFRSFGLTIEFPSEWHEDRQGTITLGLIFCRLSVCFPWYKVYLDHGQCSGPVFGFEIMALDPWDPSLWLYFGNRTCSKDRYKIVYGPWSWGSSKPIEYSRYWIVEDYHYKLRSGEVQHAIATVRDYRQEWTRPWIPWRKVHHGIDVKFDTEIGERSGTWKGGTVGCGYIKNPGETTLECLRRMERERKFR